MALTFKRRDDHDAGEHARLPIQLERLPFATLDPTDSGRVQLSLALAYGGQIQTWEASAESATGPAVALPGPFGNDLWVALGRVWNRVALSGLDLTDPEHRTVTLSYGELIRLMGKSHGRTQYAAIDETIERLRAVILYAQGTWKDGDYIRERISFPLFDLIRTTTRRDGVSDRNTATFRLSAELARAIVRHYRLLDTRALYRLRSDTGRRLYRFLEAERFNRDRRGVDVLTLTLNEIRDRLPLSETKATQLRRTLSRAHSELAKAGLLADMPTYASVKTPGVRAPVVSVTYRFPARGTPTALDSSSSAVADVPAPNYPGRAELAALLGVTAGAASRTPTDLAWWVGEIERTLGDRRSSGFYKQMVEAFASANALDALEFVLRGVARDGVGMSAKSLGSAFTARLKARARELGLALPGTPSTSDVSTRRGARVTPISALLPNTDRSPAPDLHAENHAPQSPGTGAPNESYPDPAGDAGE